jgi:hypothetical protein
MYISNPPVTKVKEPSNFFEVSGNAYFLNGWRGQPNATKSNAAGVYFSLIAPFLG